MGKHSFNTYAAILVLLAAALVAGRAIYITATTDHTNAALGNEAQYSDLQKSILGK